MNVALQIDRDEIAAFCRRYHIRRLSLFGSAIREDFSSHSDVDFLVEFEPHHVPGLVTLAGMEIELADLIGRPVEMRTAADLSHHFRDRVVENCRASLCIAMI